MASVSSLSPAEIAANKAPSIYAVVIIAFIFASLAIPLRITSRKISSAELWWDDYFMIIAYLFSCGVFAVGIYFVKAGVGKRIQVVELSNPEVATGLLKSIIAVEVCYTLSICFAKYSILLFYYRMFGIISSMRRVLIIVGIIISGWALSVLVVSSITCIPLEAFWNPSIDGKCINLPKFYLDLSITNVLTDWTMLALPLKYIWGLQLPVAQKISVIGLFIVGSFVCIVSTVRLIFVAHLDLSDITWGLSNLDIWTCTECFSAVFCACLPSLKPLYNLVTGNHPIPSNMTPVTPLATNKTNSSENSKSRRLWDISSHRVGVQHENFTQLCEDEIWESTAAVYSAKGQVDKSLENAIELENR